MTSPSQHLRCIDANINRASEACRVLEDIARFTFNNSKLSQQLKDMRHHIRQSSIPAALRHRDTPADVGTQIEASDERLRKDLASVIAANAKRGQEALRVLEETAKLEGSFQLEAEPLRYQLYEIEKQLISELPAHQLWQQKVYVLIDEDTCEDSVKLAQLLAEAPLGLIQYRAKSLSESDYYERAAVIRDALDPQQLFIVNDHVSVAAALGASGVHLGQDDAAPDLARKVLGPLALIGLSTHTPEQIAAAHQEPIDYIGLGPMFATSTKPHEQERGPTLLDALPEKDCLPSYAIGGLTLERIETIKQGIRHGVAVSGVVSQAENPSAMIASIHDILNA